jgi:hypothetical protein
VPVVAKKIMPLSIKVMLLHSSVPSISKSKEMEFPIIISSFAPGIPLSQFEGSFQLSLKPCQVVVNLKQNYSIVTSPLQAL